MNPAKPRLPSPEPVETNDVLAVAVGTGLWVVLLVVLVFLHSTLSRHHTTWWYGVCVTGIAMGLIGLWVTTRRARRRSS